MPTARARSLAVVPVALVAMSLLPGTAHAQVYADVQPQDGGVTGEAGASVVYGGAHQSVTVADGSVSTTTCAGALLAGGCTAVGDGGSGFVQADLLLYGGSVTYVAGDDGATVCSSVVYGICTP